MKQKTVFELLNLLFLVFQGASIIRMLRSFIGKDVFQAGLHDYLVAHKYGNAETKDLWQALYKVNLQKQHCFVPKNTRLLYFWIQKFP